MSAVPLASSYARRLVEAERMSSGADVRSAAAAVARRLRSPSGTIWNLLYRAPKKVSADLLHALEEACERRVERQIVELENELAALRAARRGVMGGKLAEAEASLVRLRAALREG